MAAGATASLPPEPCKPYRKPKEILCALARLCLRKSPLQENDWWQVRHRKLPGTRLLLLCSFSARAVLPTTARQSAQEGTSRLERVPGGTTKVSHRAGAAPLAAPPTPVPAPVEHTRKHDGKS